MGPLWGHMQDLAAGSDVWLVDHAVSFTRVSELLDQLRRAPDLLERVAGIVEVTLSCVCVAGIVEVTPVCAPWRWAPSGW